MLLLLLIVHQVTLTCIEIQSALQENYRYKREGDFDTSKTLLMIELSASKCVKTVYNSSETRLRLDTIWEFSVATFRLDWRAKTKVKTLVSLKQQLLHAL